MSLEAIRSQYKTLLEGIGGIGKVYDYERSTSGDWAKFLALFKTAGNKIHGWTVTREKTLERFLAGSSSERIHEMVLRGYYAVDDAGASEKTFQDLIETICSALRPKTTLGGKADQVEAPLQVSIVEPRDFGGVLCHYAELRQRAQETTSFTQKLPAHAGGGLSAIRAQYKGILLNAKPIKIGPGFFSFGDAARFMDGLTVGAVHDYERWSASWDKFLSHFRDAATSRINGWTITRESSIETFIPGSASERSHTMVVRGYYGVQDSQASEKTFQDLIEAICDIFRPETNLGGTVDQVEAPLQVDLVGYRIFGAALCHYCELRQVAQETVEFTEAA